MIAALKKRETNKLTIELTCPQFSLSLSLSLSIVGIRPLLKNVQSDQASIISGAINYVKELEQFLQFLEVQKQLKQQEETEEQAFSSATNPLTSFFTSPQYYSPISIADIEVEIVESHANLKLLSCRRPKQLLKLVMGLQNLQLRILHLNITSVEPMVLYSFSLKVEDDCRLNSVDEIAAAVHEIVLKNQEEAAIC